MKIVITGGHLSPALAVLAALPKDARPLIIGRKHTFEGDGSLSFEYKTAKTLHIPFRSITTGRLQRKFTLHTLPSLLKMPIGMLQSFVILQSFKPDVVLSFGGYISLPVVLCAKALKIPVVIHEQTLTSGLANTIAAQFAKIICISWETSKEYFPENKTVFTGNPIRKFVIKEIPFSLSRENLPLLYITGGSAGSHAINLALEGILPKLLKKFTILHQTGDSHFKDYDRLLEFRESLDAKHKARYAVEKFIDAQDIGSIMAKAHLVVSRSGMNTITELIYFSKAAVLIPLNKEQKENALFFKQVSLGEIIDGDLTNDVLYEKIMLLYGELEQHPVLKDVHNLVIEDAAQKIVAALFSSVQ